jgi:hypothetical protein
MYAAQIKVQNIFFCTTILSLGVFRSGGLRLEKMEFEFSTIVGIFQKQSDFILYDFLEFYQFPLDSL